MQEPQSILITGASSGLGAALAQEYAEPGVILFLGGRNQERLEAVAAKARARGAEVHARCLDVTNELAVLAWIDVCDGQRPLDLVIANAGISGGTHKGGEQTEAQVKDVLKTNIDGVLNTLYPILPKMKARRRGQVALMASLASFRGMPGAAAYGASKAAVRVFGEALRGEMKPFGVEVTVICPGFVKTPMTDINTCPMPFLLSAEKAATIMRRGLAQNKGRISFPWPMVFLVWLFASVPDALIDLFSIGYRTTRRTENV